MGSYLFVSPRHRQHGMLMIEVLVTILIVSLGLLGIAALSARSQQISDEAFQRFQALHIANQLAEMISVNQAEAVMGAASGYVTAGPVTTAYTPPAGPAAVNADMTTFKAALVGAGAGKLALHDARGCVEFLNSAVAPGGYPSFPFYRVSVAWQGRQESDVPAVTSTLSPGDPAAVLNCAAGAYANPNLRRVVAIDLQVPQ